jgi:hypothetical protein
MVNERNLQVGRVLRAGTRGFVIGCAVMQPEIPRFGSLVRVERIMAPSVIYGLIYDVSVEDDLFVRQFIGADAAEEVVLDQRENRQVPIEVSVLSVGCGDEAGIRHCLPPQPPVTLDWLYQCTDAEWRAFTAGFGYFRLVLNARELPADELLAASLRYAAQARPEAERMPFLLRAGRELARLLAGDPLRLETLLRQLSTG